MIRILEWTGVTSVPPQSPAAPYKWKIKTALIILKTGTGSGDRSVALGEFFPNGDGITLLTTGTQTGTSTDYYFKLDPMSTANTVLYRDIEINSDCSLQFTPTLISGDTFDAVIVVDEVPND